MVASDIRVNLSGNQQHENNQKAQVRSDFLVMMRPMGNKNKHLVEKIQVIEEEKSNSSSIDSDSSVDVSEGTEQVVS